MRRRVLRVITRLNIGGPATHVRIADEGLSKLGWETLLIHGEVERDEAEIDLDGMLSPRYRMPSLVRAIKPRSDAAALVALTKAIRQYRPHIIHTHLSKAGLLGRWAGMLVSPAPRVHTFHGTVFSGYFGRRSAAAVVHVERFLGHRTSRLIALSDGLRQELVNQRIGPPNRIQTIPLGLQLDAFRGHDKASVRRSLGIPGASPAIVAIGRLVPIKNITRLLAAFKIVHTSVPSARLYLVGDGPERQALEAIATADAIGDAVTFVGWSMEGPRWIAAADVVALSSDSEGTPLSLIEAAAAARPVVATDVGGVRAVVRDGETGFLVEREDVAALAGHLVSLLGDRNLRDTMGAAAAAGAGRFSAERLVNDLDALYRDLLDKSPSHGRSP